VCLATADGATVENPRPVRKAEKRLSKAQRRVSRRRKGSKRRTKARNLLAKQPLKVRRHRQDFPHKTALHLLRRYDTIYLEDLQVANRVRTRSFAKSVSDAAWAPFRTTRAYTAACAGKHVVVVPARDTSQDCSGCGARVETRLSIRPHLCPSCGLVLDRDENAARHIHWRGQRLRGLAGMPAGMNPEPVGL